MMTKEFSSAPQPAKVRKTSVALATATLFVFLASAPAVRAQVDCGDTIGPGGNYQLSGDLSCTDEGLTVVGPVNFNLMGFTIDCGGDSEPGITVEGEGAVIQNGTITDCGDGVRVGGSGGHQLLNLTAADNESDGIQLDSDNNTLVGNSASDNEGDGFDIESSGNQLINNFASGNGNEGFDIDEGDEGSNRLVGNTAHDNNEEGFEIDEDSTENELVNNTATDNGESGFDIEGESNRLTRNSASGNGEHGFEVDGDENELKNNTAIDNTENGILVDDGMDNVVRHNTAEVNGADDLADSNVDCDDNTWAHNVFETSNQGCID